MCPLFSIYTKDCFDDYTQNWTQNVAECFGCEDYLGIEMQILTWKSDTDLHDEVG